MLSVYFPEANLSKPIVEYPPELNAVNWISSFLKSVCFKSISVPFANVICLTSVAGYLFLLMILDPVNSSLINSTFFKLNW